MEPEAVGIVLLVIGIIFIIAEAATPGFFIGIIGTALIAMGLIGIFFPYIYDTPWSTVIVVVVTLCSMLGTIMFYRRLGKPQPTATTITESNVGREGLVLEDIDPHTLHGKVRIKHQVWSATADMHIPKGKMIKVVDWEGIHVIVEEIKEEEPHLSRESEEAKV